MITRFAPSPTGPLHLGHAYSARRAFDAARVVEGTFLLRIDDIDRARSRACWETQLIEDLTWLGLTWPTPVLRQSQSAPQFADALARLAAMGLTYPCSCSRADIEAAASAPQEDVPSHGPDGRIYPGTCRGRSMSEMGDSDAIRLDIAKAVKALAPLPSFTDLGEVHPGRHALDPGKLVSDVGDVVLSRRSGDIAYHVAVIVDDFGQSITDVIRGADLFEATQIHVLLQHALGMPQPVYLHHRLIRDDAGKRLAKRDDARAIRKFRDDGMSPAQVLALVGL